MYYKQGQLVNGQGHLVNGQGRSVKTSSGRQIIVRF